MCPFPKKICLELLQEFIGGRELSDISVAYKVNESVLRSCFETLGYSVSALRFNREGQNSEVDERSLLIEKFYSELNQLAASGSLLKDSKACHLFARALHYLSNQNRGVDGEISMLIKDRKLSERLLITRGPTFVGDLDPMLSVWKSKVQQHRTSELVRRELAMYLKHYGVGATREMLNMAIEIGHVLPSLENGSVIIPFEQGKPVTTQMIIKEYIW